ncbi:MAG: hypothetical protein D3906_14245 [Candidatus Electrothrix sp. AUS1_2]|nr:hypothetical protein [Candidatus Electrothrix sp. AUS1_2]
MLAEDLSVNLIQVQSGRFVDRSYIPKILAGLSKRAFAEILADYNVSLINYPPADILRDAAQLLSSPTPAV